MRSRFRPLLGIAMLLLALGPMTSPVRSGDATPATPPAEILLSLDLAGEIEWYYASDVGLLLVSGDQKLHRIDLLTKDGGALSPVPGNGILLVAEAPAGAGPAGRDAAAGRETSPYAVESFVAYRSFDDDGHMLAVDIRPGKRLWEHAVPVSSVWTEGPFQGLQTGSSLWTVVPRTGESARRGAVPGSKKTRLYALPEEGALIVWEKRELEAFSLPPAPPAEPAPSSPSRTSTSRRRCPPTPPSHPEAPRKEEAEPRRRAPKLPHGWPPCGRRRRPRACRQPCGITRERSRAYPHAAGRRLRAPVSNQWA